VAFRPEESRFYHYFLWRGRLAREPRLL